MWRIDHRYATRDELKEVHDSLKKNEHCLNQLQDSVIEIQSGIKIAGWLFAAAIALIPIITNVVDYARRDNVQQQMANPIPTQIYVLPENGQLQQIPPHTANTPENNFNQ